MKTSIFFLICFPSCYRSRFARWWLADEQFLMAPLDLYCWCTWYLRATGPAQNFWVANPNPFRGIGDNPIKSTTKGNLKKLQQHRDLFPPDFSGRISTGEGGAGTGEHLPGNNYSILNHRFLMRETTLVSLLGSLKDCVLHGWSLLWTSTDLQQSYIFTKTVL